MTRVQITAAGGTFPIASVASVLVDPKRVAAAAAGIELRGVEIPELPILTTTEDWPRVVPWSDAKGPLRITLEARGENGVVSVRQESPDSTQVLRTEVLPDGTHQVSIELSLPDGVQSTEYRWHAMDPRGVLSRPVVVRLVRDVD